jgi:hypothetical protein
MTCYDIGRSRESLFQTGLKTWLDLTRFDLT